MLSPANSDLSVWQGVGVSSGTAEGFAYILDSEHDFADVKEEHVLVVRHATPALLPCLLKAQAAVCESGGVLSHIAILARELRKPCVTGLAGIVQMIPPGARIRVDGTSGSVELLPPVPDDLPQVATAQHPHKPRDNNHERMARLEAPSEPSDFVPILQFGYFSSAFEHTKTVIDLQTIVRMAALLSIPAVFDRNSLWQYELVDNRLLISKEAFRTTTQRLVDLLETKTLGVDALHAQYMALVDWDGWRQVAAASLSAHSGVDRSLLKAGLANYVTLNQITWFASIVREESTKRYQKFLQNHLQKWENRRVQSLFLDSLIMPNQSYILQSYVDEAGLPNVWSGTSSSAREPETRRQNRARTKELAAASLHKADVALRTLASHLSEDDFELALNYLHRLTILGDVTEQKNTLLHQCGLALFGQASHLNILAELLNLPPSALISTGWQLDRGGLDASEAKQNLTSLLDMLLTRLLSEENTMAIFGDIFGDIFGSSANRASVPFGSG